MVTIRGGNSDQSSHAEELRDILAIIITKGSYALGYDNEGTLSTDLEKIWPTPK